MIYEMNLHPSPFELIKSGRKDIEMRLNDDRRKGMKIGDHILFTNNETKEKLEVEIVNLYHYNDFNELYSHFPKERLGYLPEEIANPKDMNLYYSDELINLYGVLGIEISLIK